jgi:hypothetical protein
MGVCVRFALGFVAAKADTPHACLCGRLFVFTFQNRKVYMFTFFAKQGVLPPWEGVIQTSEGVLPTSEGLFPTKQAILREIKGLFCTNQHVANTKFARKCTFCPKNALFWKHLRFSLLPNLYMHPQRGILVHRDYGPSVQNSAWGGAMSG